MNNINNIEIYLKSLFNDAFLTKISSKTREKIYSFIQISSQMDSMSVREIELFKNNFNDFMEMHFYELSTAMFKIEKSEFKKLVKFGVRQGKPYIKKDEKSLIKLLCELSVTYVPTGEKMYLGNEDIKRMVISLMNQEQLNKLFEECQS